MSLYDRVRDGNGCFPHDWSPTNSFIRAVHSKLHSNNKLNAFINLSLMLRLFRYCGAQDLRPCAPTSHHCVFPAGLALRKHAPENTGEAY